MDTLRSKTEVVERSIESLRREVVELRGDLGRYRAAHHDLSQTEVVGRLLPPTYQLLSGHIKKVMDTAQARLAECERMIGDHDLAKRKGGQS